MFPYRDLCIQIFTILWPDVAGRFSCELFSSSCSAFDFSFREDHVKLLKSKTCKQLNYVTYYKEFKILKHRSIPYTWISDKCRPLRLPPTTYNFSSTTAAACYNEGTKNGVSILPKAQDGFLLRNQEWQMTFSIQKKNNHKSTTPNYDYIHAFIKKVLPGLCFNGILPSLNENKEKRKKERKKKPCSERVDVHQIQWSVPTLHM